MRIPSRQAGMATGWLGAWLLGGVQSSCFASDTQIVDATALGVAGNSYVSDHAISDDGRYVAFTSSANNLVPGTFGTWFRAYVRDVETGSLTLVSKTSTGIIPNDNVQNVRISGDGRYVIFVTGTALVPSDQNGLLDVYAYDRITDTLECVSLDANGLPGSGDWSTDSIHAPRSPVSTDGRYVVFSSTAKLVPGDLGNTRDCYVRDRVLNQTILVSTNGSGNDGNGNTFAGAVSGDGSVIAFKTLATDLVGTSAAGVYAKDMQSGTLTRVDKDSAGVPISGTVGARVAISASGFHVGLEANNQIYAFNLVTNTLELISKPMTPDSPTIQSYGPSLSADGRYVAFESNANKMVLWDVNSFSLSQSGVDVFLRDRLTQRTILVNVSNSFVQSTSSFASSGCVSGDGRMVSFISQQSLVPGVSPNFTHVYRRNRLGFANMGFGIAGVSGIPVLSGSGSTSAGGAGALQLSSAAPNSTSILLLSLDRGLFAPTGGPLKSSVLVTSNAILVLTVPTDAAGGWTLPFVLPPGQVIVPELYAQCAVIDATVTQGVSLSNALNLGFE